MTEFNLIQIAIAILFLPLAGFVFVLFFGKKIKNAYIVEVSILTLTFILTAVLLFSKLSWFMDKNIVSEFSWISYKNIAVFGNISIDLGFLLDNLSVIMIFTVALISMLVHFFSMAYMKGDRIYNRYFAYLGLFTFSMSGIVLTHNILMMYVFWELVGISSYLLIGFWYEKKSASDAGKKAFLVNRIGDIGMFSGIMILFNTYHTFTFEKIFTLMANGTLPFNSEFWLTVTGITYYFVVLLANLHNSLCMYGYLMLWKAPRL